MRLQPPIDPLERKVKCQAMLQTIIYTVLDFETDCRGDGRDNSTK